MPLSALAATALMAPVPPLERPALDPGTDRVFGVKPPGLVREPRAPLGQEDRGLLRRVAVDPEPAPAEAALPVDGAVHVGDGVGERTGGHDGVDLLAECGRPVRAVAAGRVVLSDDAGSAGRHVVLRLGGRGGEAVYMHLQDVDVRAGQEVEAGRRIGTLGDTGNATTCHLHFERWSPPGWQRGAVLDPEPRLRAIAGDRETDRLGAPDPGPQRSSSDG